MAARGLAVLYGGAARARRALYRRGWCKVRRLPAPVVSVGNLTVGGTGKTPLVACLARELLNQGVKVAILSRGYGGRRKAVTCLSDGRQVFHKPPEVGEEAYCAGQSGAGKTTLARLWHDESGVTILSDDRVVVRKMGDRIWMYGTPWHGEALLASPAKVPLTRVFLLRHGRKNELVRQVRADAVSRLLACSFVPFHSPSGIDFTLGFLEEVAERFPCDELTFVPDKPVVAFIRDAKDR